MVPRKTGGDSGGNADGTFQPGLPSDPVLSCDIVDAPPVDIGSRRSRRSDAVPGAADDGVNGLLAAVGSRALAERALAGEPLNVGMCERPAAAGRAAADPAVCTAPPAE